MIRPIAAMGLICILVSFQPAWGGDFQPAQEIDNVLSLAVEIIKAPCDILAIFLGIDGHPGAPTQPPKRSVLPGRSAKKVTKAPTTKKREPAQEPVSELAAPTWPSEPGRTAERADTERPARPATAPATPTPKAETFEGSPEPPRAPGTRRVRSAPAAPEVKRRIEKGAPDSPVQWMPCVPVYPWTPPRFPKPCW